MIKNATETSQRHVHIPDFDAIYCGDAANADRACGAAALSGKSLQIAAASRRRAVAGAGVAPRRP